MKARFVDRYETSVGLLVVLWSSAFFVRARLIQSGRLSDSVNEALMSLLFVVPIMLLGWFCVMVAGRLRARP